MIYIFSFPRSNSVTPPAAKSIPRSSTYEKISKPVANSTEKPKQQQTTSTPHSAKPKQTASVVSKLTVKRNQPQTTKSSGGPRIVKPVTPRPKVNAITSKSLRQSNFSYSEMRSYAISSGPSACISIERTSRSSQDTNVSIPLVTAPFAYGSHEESNTVENKEKVTEINGEHSSQVNSNTSSVNKQDSESDNSENEDA